VAVKSFNLVNHLKIMRSAFKFFERTQLLHFVRTDLQGRYTFVNLHYVRTFGLRPNAYAGLCSLKAIYPQDVEKYRNAWLAAQLHPEKFFAVRVRKLERRGKVQWYNCELMAVKDAKGDVVEVQDVAYLLSKKEQKFHFDKEDQLRFHQERLLEIAYFQSHAVRSPLSNILGIMQLIDERNLTEENLQLLQALQHSAQKLDEVIHEIVRKTV
jgi:signal transduction histidine kinase